ncbi:recombinase family protein [Naasia sp. SYSU D00057]|uniref:recombinase family protein n=1 Tax=Naasia sp. SYSU D00057 TaxID=2817380 RepID=UPI001B312558|nr:recombinase family protein [Naasia sp. SYSU D00057]
MSATRAAVYLRISRDAEALGLAVDRQREDCKRLVAAHGWTLTEEYVDNSISASKRTVFRPAYDRLVRDYAAGRFDALVVYDLDRLTRQPRQLEDWIDAAEERGLVILTANGEADLSTDNGRLFARIKASVARAEIERKGARQKRANVQRGEQGRPIPGRRRYGYESDGVTPREGEAAVVRRMFDHVATGGSIRSLYLALEGEGVDPAPGKEWSPRRVRDILTNEHYAGYVRHRGAVLKSDVVEPIVDEALAADVRALLADPTRKTTPGNAPRHLASGIARCGVCGDAIIWMREYRCRRTTHPSITGPRLEGRIRQEIARALLTSGPDVFDGAEVGTIAALVERRRRNAEAVAAVLADRDEGLVPADVARSRLLGLRTAREGIEAALDAARSSHTSSGALATIAHELLGEATEWPKEDFATLEATIIARFDALDLDRRREVLRALLHVEIGPGRHPSRVRVEHRLATHLNPLDQAGNPQDEDARYYTD